MKRKYYHFLTLFFYYSGDLTLKLTDLFYSFNPECGEDSKWDKIGSKLYRKYSNLMNKSLNYDIKGRINFWKESNEK